MKKLRLLAAGLASLGILLGLAPAVTLASCSDGNLSPQEALQCGTSGAAGKNPSATPANATDTFNNIVSTILNILTVTAGILGVIMIILAGSRFITSGGNQEKVASARRAVIYAAIGLAIAALAQTIAVFVVHKATTTEASSASSSASTSSSSSSSGGKNPAPISN